MHHGWSRGRSGSLESRASSGKAQTDPGSCEPIPHATLLHIASVMETIIQTLWSERG